MRYLILSDIHANQEALEAVLEQAGDWDATLFLGDLVGYGPNPNECAERVQELPNLTSVIGNHDVVALGQIDPDDFNPLAKSAALWTQREMSPDTRTFLESLGQVEELDGLTMVHGSPRDPIWEYLDQLSQAPESFARFTTTVCVCGHTHVPRVFTQHPGTRALDMYVPEATAAIETTDGARRILNPGSVGQPRDGDPRAAFAILDADSGTFGYHRVAYNISRTQEKMVRAGLPKPLADRLQYGF